MKYVDGFLLPVAKKNVAAYQRMAAKAGRIWLEHGALQFCESVGDDLAVRMGLPFPRAMKLKMGELPVFSWILFKSRAHRDRVNARVMKDPRIARMMDAGPPPFDFKRMCYGGFKVLVDR
jgi:uncharacterized protein YbaA (DUF1428 family)